MMKILVDVSFPRESIRKDRSNSIDGMKFCTIINNSTVNDDIFAAYIRELCSYLRNVRGVREA